MEIKNYIASIFKVENLLLHIATLNEKFFLHLPNIVQISLVFLAAFLISKSIERIMYTFLISGQNDRNMALFLTNLLKKLIFFFSIILTCDILKINIQGFLSIFGIASVSIGFALKDSFANVIAGVSIILLKPFKVGDYINLTTNQNGVDEGTIIKIDLRYTTLEKNNTIIIVPNSIMNSNPISIIKNNKPH